MRETLYENTEEKLRDFLGQELKIEHWIEFGNVLDRENQRMKTCEKSYQALRPIVARFIYHRDLVYVLENTKTIEVETIWN